jgi:LmbE family N-acetylglucosaminyl deacetylase
MAGPLRLLAIYAHPDDETLGVGGTLARYAAEGVETYLLTATRGERGRFDIADVRPPDEEVGRVREQELHNAAAVLGIREVRILDFLDKELDSAPPAAVIGDIVTFIRQVRPDVVITFPPDGAYGHPDHVAISQLATGAIVAAADAGYAPGTGATHRVAKLYFNVSSPAQWQAYQAAFKRLVSTVDGEEREAQPWPEWSITSWIDTRAHSDTVWRAVKCHRTQISMYQALATLGPDDHEALWGTQQFYRVFSLVNGGRDRESDLFAGLRPPGGRQP